MNIFEWGMNQAFNVYYEECCKTLDLNRYHSSSSLKKAYHKKVFESHPDKGGSTEEFIKVNEAYKFLNSLQIDQPQYSKCKEYIPQEKIKNDINLKIKKEMNISEKDKLNQEDKIKEKEKQKYSNNKNKIKQKKRNINYKSEIELSDA